MKPLIAALMLLSLADAPLPNQGGSGPGGLGATEVTGKRLLDARAR